MSLLGVAVGIGLLGVLVYGYGFYRGFSNRDDWAASMVIKNAGFVVIVVSLTLLIVRWVQP